MALLVVVVAGTAAVWWLFLRSTPEETVAAFIKAAESGDAERIDSYLSAETVKLADELEGLYEDYYGATPNYVLRGLFSLWGWDILGAQTTIEKAKFHSEGATVQVVFEAEAGQFTPGRLKMMSSVDLVRENGVWKIDLTGAPLFPSRDNRGRRVTHTLRGMHRVVAVAEAMTAKEAGDYKEAEKEFREVIALDPDNVRAHWGLAWVLAETDRKEEAIEEFKWVAGRPNPERRHEAEAAIKRLQLKPQ